MQTFQTAVFAALLLLTGCQGGGTPASPTAAASKSCQQTCNTEYDTCMDRFAGAGGGPRPAEILPQALFAGLRHVVLGWSA